jgi:curved DNA-binding protein CbpA
VDFQHCLRLLELKTCSSQEEARRAYRDLVRVWHPDRFSGDPRLRRKAEEKVKELNIAYEELIRHLERRASRDHDSTPDPGSREADSMGSTEALFEAGTRTILTLWHSLSRAVRAAVGENQDEATERHDRDRGS